MCTVIPHYNVPLLILDPFRDLVSILDEDGEAVTNADGEILTRCQFHQHFTCPFYERRSQKRKKTLITWLSFYTIGIWTRKSSSLNVDEIEGQHLRRQVHTRQHRHPRVQVKDHAYQIFW